MKYNLEKLGTIVKLYGDSNTLLEVLRKSQTLVENRNKIVASCSPVARIEKLNLLSCTTALFYKLMN